MSITNYSELQAAVASWSHRSDLTSVIPDFITIAEGKIFNRLRIRAMEANASGTVAATVTLPTGFVEMISLTVTSGGTTWPLEYTSPNNINAETGSPTKYSIVGENLYFLPVGSGMTYTLNYYKPLDSVTGSTNWLITNAPYVYLYGALVEVSDYSKDDTGLQKYSARLDEAIGQLMRRDLSDRYGSGLAVRVA